MTGRNYGLKGLRHVLLILVPAALPQSSPGFVWAGRLHGER